MITRKVGEARASKRGAKRNIKVHMTVDEVTALYEQQGGRCAVTGIELTHEGGAPTDLSIDRINADGNYEVGNIRLVAWAVNHMRGRMSDEELLFWAKSIYEGLSSAD